MIILVPAYEPDHKLVDLVRSIRATRPWQDVVLVDDGSGPEYAAVFDSCAALGCEVVRHDVNRGKGAALKTGFAHVARRHPGRDVVCADCDGQHTITDILRVADEVRRHPDGIVLGARQFVGDVPARSRFGNDLTRSVFRLVTGVRLQDTQTGLRGYPAALLPWLGSIRGDRFEYELEALLASQHAGHRFHEVPIETIYLADNESSHFRPLHDSIRVYRPFLRHLRCFRVARFGLSSFAAFVVDAVLFFALVAATGRLLPSVVVARVISASMNFVVNRRLVFGHRDRDGLARSARRYASLALVLLAADYALLAALTHAIAMPLVPAKFLTEITLFVASYLVQRRHVFARHERRSALVDAPVGRSAPSSIEVPALASPVGVGAAEAAGAAGVTDRA